MTGLRALGKPGAFDPSAPVRPVTSRPEVLSAYGETVTGSRLGPQVGRLLGGRAEGRVAHALTESRLGPQVGRLLGGGPSAVWRACATASAVLAVGQVGATCYVAGILDDIAALAQVAQETRTGVIASAEDCRHGRLAVRVASVRSAPPVRPPQSASQTLPY